MIIDEKLWKIDKGRRKFLTKSTHELKNSQKRFKDHKESVQIRIAKDAYIILRKEARTFRKTISNTATAIINNALSANK